MSIFQLQNRQEIRHAIGRNLGIAIIGIVTSTVDKTSLIDTLYLLGGDDEHNGKQVRIYDATGSIVDGETQVVTDFDNTPAGTSDATCVTFTQNITTGDKYEMWKTPWWIADIDDAINQAINEVTARALIDRQTDSNFTRSKEYIYDWLVPYAFGNDFKLLYKVEYVDALGISHNIHLCEVEWDELEDAEVTQTLDTTYNVEGNNCIKLVVASGAEANDILVTDVIDELDISDCDQLEVTIRSSGALAAGAMQILLDNTAQCASPVESLAIPATLANTTTTHVIDLANPHSDTAIISVGIKLITDAANTLYFDRIKAVKSSSKRYEPLSSEYWSIVKGTTPKLALTSTGLSIVGANTQVRLTGFCAPDIFSDDTTDSEVDPAYLIAQVTGRLLISHAKSSFLDIHNRAELSKYWLGEAKRMLPGLSPSMPGTVRSI